MIDPLILLPVLTYPDASQTPALCNALAIARALDGRVSAIIHEVDIPPVRSLIPMLGDHVEAMALQAELSSRSSGDRLLLRLHDMAKAGPPLQVSTLETRIEQAGDTIAALARIYDLVVMPSDERDELGIGAAVLFGSGGPVILAPAIDVSINLDHVMIAWDGSRAAARAVRDASDIVARAKSVSIVSIIDDKLVERACLSGLTELLAHRGIAAKQLEASRGKTPIGEMLQDFAISRGAGILVMGAYGHSRLREFVLGGATRDVIRDTRLPVFMSH
ncbi:universal stress protein [Devosia nitrariae]|uniref:Universal stress protein UspA n=1 Tax=Devosia nitrariae TaxID=2071872 RepID=A0ABQ5WAF6_9HYPH|nr:universal stress protein [Devosia nitrariae]GLQ56626.1 universal stress protein UspA [Devosia nitrariae]